MFKSQITARSEEGIALGLDKWLEFAKENGHFERKTHKSPITNEEEDKSASVDEINGEITNGIQNEVVQLTKPLKDKSLAQNEPEK